MSDILREIIEHKRGEVRADRARVPLAEMKARAADADRPRNFFRAVTAPNPTRKINLIAEIKKASPSAGLIRDDFDPVALAHIYDEAGAQAISVLTDERYFQGRLEFLARVRQAVDLPLLRKDFIIDEYQVYESRAAGADAILLIAEALPVGQLIDLLILSTELNLSCLLEVHEAESVMRLRSLPGFPRKHFAVLGINNRDLRTMRTDINHTRRMMSLLEDEMPVVSESGIGTRADVEQMIAMGCAALLIGETFMRSEDVAAKVHELMNGT
jgi:indole-3-glycerol phosphate synthase